jgi:asparagine synthase (glutamine-hydrolysing)
MSGFFGVISPAGNLDQAAFDQMRSCVPTEANSSVGIFMHENAAMGHLLITEKSNSISDNQPLISECGRYLLVGHFRLDYRDELGDKLGLSHDELVHTRDAILVLKSYQKWGKKCANYFEGDWAFVLYDFYDSSTFFAKDTLGFSAIFYTIQNNTIYFSSNPQFIYSITTINKEVDKIEFFKFCALRNTVTQGNTLFRGIYSVKSATSLIIDKELKVSQISLSTIFSNKPLLYKYTDDYKFELQSIFSLAILSRISRYSSVGLSLSSGRDSTSVFYFASKILEHRKNKIFTYTWDSFNSDLIDLQKKLRVDETLRVKNMLSEFNNVESRFIDCVDHKYSSCFNFNKQSNILNPLVGVNSLWINEMYYRLRQDQVKLLLVAPIGNFSITWTAPMIKNSLLKKFKLYEFLKLIYLDQKGYKFFLLRRIKKPIKDFYLFFSDLLSLTKKNISIVKKHIFLSEDQAKSLLKPPKVPNFNYHTDFYLHKYIIENRVADIGIDWYLDSLNASHIVTDPTGDTRLLKFCFSVPEELFNLKNEQRYIYKRMMKDRLPNYIVESNKVYPQAYNSGEIFAKDKRMLEIMDNSFSDELVASIFNLSVMKKSYELAIQNYPSVHNVICVDKCLKYLSLAEFVRKNSNFIK